MHTKKDEITLYQMYIFSGTSAIEKAPDADGITIVQTAKGNEYRFPLYMNRPFVPEAAATLTESEDIQINYLIHVWHDHTLDMPAYDLRQALMELHPENRNALMMLAGETGFTILPLGDTLR